MQHRHCKEEERGMKRKRSEFDGIINTSEVKTCVCVCVCVCARLQGESDLQPIHCLALLFPQMVCLSRLECDEHSLVFEP